MVERGGALRHVGTTHVVFRSANLRFWLWVVPLVVTDQPLVGVACMSCPGSASGATWSVHNLAPVQERLERSRSGAPAPIQNCFGLEQVVPAWQIGFSRA
jgi:hypothetical protein